jgi:hypothetical protein
VRSRLPCRGYRRRLLAPDAPSRWLKKWGEVKGVRPSRGAAPGRVHPGGAPLPDDDAALVSPARRSPHFGPRGPISRVTCDRRASRSNLADADGRLVQASGPPTYGHPTNPDFVALDVAPRLLSIRALATRWALNAGAPRSSHSSALLRMSIVDKEPLPSFFNIAAVIKKQHLHIANNNLSEIQSYVDCCG